MCTVLRTPYTLAPSVYHRQDLPACPCLSSNGRLLLFLLGLCLNHVTCGTVGPSFHRPCVFLLFCEVSGQNCSSRRLCAAGRFSFPPSSPSSVLTHPSRPELTPHTSPIQSSPARSSPVSHLWSCPVAKAPPCPCSAAAHLPSGNTRTYRIHTPPPHTHTPPLPCLPYQAYLPTKLRSTVRWSTRQATTEYYSGLDLTGRQTGKTGHRCLFSSFSPTRHLRARAATTCNLLPGLVHPSRLPSF